MLPHLKSTITYLVTSTVDRTSFILKHSPTTSVIPIGLSREKKQLAMSSAIFDNYSTNQSPMPIQVMWEAERMLQNILLSNISRSYLFSVQLVIYNNAKDYMRLQRYKLLVSVRPLISMSTTCCWGCFDMLSQGHPSYGLAMCERPKWEPCVDTMLWLGSPSWT